MPAEPLVSVIVLTYNHRAYIDQCLKSILAQKTDFPFEIVVSDDASTDETPAILQNWENQNKEIVLSLLPENGGAAKSFANALRMSSGKYIAYCEGDDFWADPLKLRIQTESLENNPGVSIVFSNYGSVDPEGEIICESILDDSGTFSISDFIDGHGPVLHASVLRSTVFPDRLPGAFFTVHNPDVFIIGWALIHGKSKFIDATMSMYRIHDQGIYSSLPDDEKRLLRYSTRLKFFDSAGSVYQTEYDIVLKKLIQTLSNLRKNGKVELVQKYLPFLPFSVRFSLSLKRFYSRFKR